MGSFAGWACVVPRQQYRRAIDIPSPPAAFTLFHARSHSLSSLPQVGPIRLCADLRFALEPTAAEVAASADNAAGPSHSPSDASSAHVRRRGSAALERLRGLPRHVASTRASLMDSVYGLDVALPGASGLARLVAWYSPGRREGMVEVRLF